MIFSGCCRSSLRRSGKWLGRRLRHPARFPKCSGRHGAPVSRAFGAERRTQPDHACLRTSAATRDPADPLDHGLLRPDGSCARSDWLLFGAWGSASLEITYINSSEAPLEVLLFLEKTGRSPARANWDMFEFWLTSPFS